ncbi:MAG: transaldolase family protein [Desulfatiglandales bacterium]
MNHERESPDKDPGLRPGHLLDFLRRKMITSGELRELIEEDCLRGMTSNPKIFDKVIAGSHDYDDDISALALEKKRPVT